MENICCLVKGAVKDVRSDEKFQAIKELITKVQSVSEIGKITDLENVVITREKVQTTGLGDGVALAHGKTHLTDKTYVCLGVSKKGISFGALDGKPVHLLFIIVNHPEHQMEYLTVISTIAKLVNNKTFRNTLISIPDLSRVEEVFTEAFHANLIKRLPYMMK